VKDATFCLQTFAVMFIFLSVEDIYSYVKCALFNIDYLRHCMWQR